MNAIKDASKYPEKRGKYLTYGCAKTAEIIFAAGTNHLLAMYYHFKDLGPNVSSPYKSGTKTTERIISELQGKTNQIQCLDAQPTVGDIINRISNIQFNQSSEDRLIQLGAKKQSSTNRRRISHSIKSVTSELYSYPSQYTVFLEEQRNSHRGGVKKGMELFEKYCGEAAMYLKEKNVWTFLQEEVSIVPIENQFVGSLPTDYAAYMLRNVKSAELLQVASAEEESSLELVSSVDDYSEIIGETVVDFQPEKQELINEINEELSDEEMDQDIYGKKKWYVSKKSGNEMKNMHIKRALKLIMPREYVSRERSRRHIAANYLPGLQPIDKEHDIHKFRFVILKLSSGFWVGKIIFLSKDGKPVLSACSQDSSGYSFRALLLKEVENEEYVYPEPIQLTRWLKMENIISPVHLSLDGHQYRIRKEDGIVLKNARTELLVKKDVVFGKKLLKEDVPYHYLEVKEILDRKLDSKTHNYSYLVKFSEETENVWLPGQNFYETVQYSRRGGSSIGSKRQFALPIIPEDVASKKVKISSNCSTSTISNVKKMTSFFSKAKDSVHTVKDIKNSISIKNENDNSIDKLSQNIVKKSPISSKSDFKKVTSLFNAKVENRVAESDAEKTKISTTTNGAFCKLEKPPRKKSKQTTKVNNMIVSKLKAFKRVVAENTDPDYVIKQLLLKQEDLDLLINKQCLVSNHIYASIVLLKKQFPKLNGMHHPLREKAMANAKENSIEFHHNGDNHWLLFSNITGKVVVYDSIYRSPNKHTEKQLCSLYRDQIQNFKLEVELLTVQTQKGVVECGLFAIAFAVDLAFGNDPATIFYDQDDMRSHLLDGFHDMKLELFPRTKELHFARENIINKYIINVSCSCGLPDNEDMVKCSLCHRLYHKVCFEDTILSIVDWECDDCKP